MGIISQDCSANRHGSLYDSRLKVVLFPEGSLVNKEFILPLSKPFSELASMIKTSGLLPV